jgi:hypothetical protein
MGLSRSEVFALEYGYYLTSDLLSWSLPSAGGVAGFKTFLTSSRTRGPLTTAPGPGYLEPIDSDARNRWQASACRGFLLRRFFHLECTQNLRRWKRTKGAMVRRRPYASIQ